MSGTARTARRRCHEPQDPARCRPAVREPQRRGSRVRARRAACTSASATAARAATPRTARRTCRRLLGKLLTPRRATAGIRRRRSSALGLRNPWRYSFDARRAISTSATSARATVEEVDFTAALSAGLENYGWDVYEGSQRFDDKALRSGHARVPRLRVHPRPRLHGHRRVRLSRQGAPGRARPVHLRRLLQRDDRWSSAYRAAASGRTCERSRSRSPSLTSFGEDAAGRAVRDVTRGTSSLPDQLARRRARAAAPGRAPRRRARSATPCSSWSSRAMRVKPILPLGRAVQALELVGDPVEPLEQRVELAVSDVVLLHDQDSRRTTAARSGCRVTRRRVRAIRGRAQAEDALERAVLRPRALRSRRAAPSCASATRASCSGASVKTPSSTPSGPRASCRAALVAASRRR